MVSKVVRSWPQGIYNSKSSIRINIPKHMSTSKELHNKSRGRRQRQASKESNIYLKFKRNILQFCFEHMKHEKRIQSTPTKVYRNAINFLFLLQEVSYQET